jgi:hypothetical protein
MARVRDALVKPSVLADCLEAWARHEDGLDTRAGVLVVAEMIQRVNAALTKS